MLSFHECCHPSEVCREYRGKRNEGPAFAFLGFQSRRTSRRQYVGCRFELRPDAFRGALDVAHRALVIEPLERPARGDSPGA